MLNLTVGGYVNYVSYYQRQNERGVDIIKQIPVSRIGRSPAFGTWLRGKDKM